MPCGALQPVLDCIDEKGVVQQVSYGTPMGRESKDFYKQIPLHPMPYGQAMAILFLMEAEPSLMTKNGAAALPSLPLWCSWWGLAAMTACAVFFPRSFKSIFP